MADFDPDAFLAAPTPAAARGAGSFDPDAFLGEPAPAPRSFLERAGDKASEAAGAVGRSFENLGHTAASALRGAVDLVSPISKEGGFQVPFGQLADPAYRHQLERGVSDTVTGGLAEKAANAVSPEFAATAAPDAAAAPDARALGQVGGTLLPSPFGKLAEAGGIVPGTGPLASAGRGVVGYEASAVPQAATQAAINAPEGHRLEAAGHAALEAATDPAGLVTSATIPATTSFLQKKLDVAAARAPEVQEAAKKRAVKDLGKDITSAEGPKARVTDQKRIAEVNDRLYDLADKNPELRQAFSEPAEKALPKVRAFKAKIAGPLDRLYDAIDEKTGGGLDPHHVVGELRDMAKQEGSSVAGRGDAKRISDLADQFDQVYIKERAPAAPAPSAPTEAPATHPLAEGEPPLHSEEWWKETQREWEGKKGHSTVGEATNVGGKGGAEPEFSPEQIHKQIETLRKVRENASPVAAKGIDEQIGKLEDEVDSMAKTQAAPAPTMPAGGAQKIPTRVFRDEVTALLKKSDSVMGGIEGTPRFEALQKLYDGGKRIIDKHIDGSGLPAEQIAQIRDINNGYFLLSRAEQAIESRGFKEANKPGFQFPHTIRQAVHGGGLGAIATAAAMAGPHAAVHALPYVAGATLATHALPKVMKTVNWELAHGAYGRAVNRLIDVARKVPRPEFIGQAARAGLGTDAAQRIYDAANAPAQQGATP